MLELGLLCWLCLARPPVETPRPRPPTINKWLTIAHAGAVGYDLATTRVYVHEGFVEKDPLTRPLIGTRPTVGRMTAWGSLEVGAAALVARKYPRVGKWVQVAAIVAHVACASHNLTLGGRK